MQLWFVETCSGGVRERQRFGEHREPCFWLRYQTVGFGEHRQKIRSAYLCSCRTIGSQALLDLLDAFLSLSLVCQYPAAQYSTECLPLRKSLFRGEDNGGFST